MRRARPLQGSPGEPEQQRESAGHRQGNVSGQKPSGFRRGAHDHDGDPAEPAGGQDRGAEDDGERRRGALAEEPSEPDHTEEDAEPHVEHDVGEVEEGRAGECRQVCAVQQKQNEPR